jgi:ribosomal protein L14/ribosomal protein L16/L10AE
MVNIRFKKKKSLDNRFSNTSVYKYKKFYKIKYNFTAVNPLILSSCNVNSFFKISLISTSVRLFKAKNLKSFKMFIRKPYTKIISIPAVPYMGFTKKPSEVRMGKGKGGKVSFRAFPLRIGSVITQVPQRFFPILSCPRTLQKLRVYSNKFNSAFSHIVSGFFLNTLSVFLLTNILIYLIYLMETGTKIIVQDTTGIQLVKCIRPPKLIRGNYLGAVILISILLKDSRKKRIKYGRLYRALIINSSRIVFRRSGHYIKGYNSAILLKRTGFVSISKRIKGPVCSELRRVKLNKIMAMGSFVF